MVREQRVESFYAWLRESAKASALTLLLIFPSTSDVDSLCALKIMFHILESDSVRYPCYPVSSFQEIHKYIGDDLSFSSDERISILLINWGCHRDLRRDLKLGLATRVFVVDRHRPIHLHNLSDQNEQVVVLYTHDDEQQADLAYDFDVMELANASNCLHNSKLYGEDYEDGNESEDEDEDDEEEDGEGDGSRKRRRTTLENVEEPNSRRFKKLKREYYHMGTFHGKPSGFLMYDLSHSLRKNSNELLWLACVCVSLSDKFVHERLTDERYQAGVMELATY
ncbi:hypothetical protein SLEP1_g42359 [Rubroshorea leprosula]|uniref:Uncharacterized protein n=1 Tax=Rubroshorea leprosula TaxID=152421 RepID=A0AAV5LAG2_9ROSI|nr:hypothetical protein SLEP1_g42359 [Rubroshorea leprosula]